MTLIGHWTASKQLSLLVSSYTQYTTSFWLVCPLGAFLVMLINLDLLVCQQLYKAFSALRAYALLHGYKYTLPLSLLIFCLASTPVVVDIYVSNLASGHGVKVETDYS